MKIAARTQNRLSSQDEPTHNMCGEISNSNLHLVEDFSEDLSDVHATQTKRVKKMVLVNNASFVHHKSARNLA